MAGVITNNRKAYDHGDLVITMLGNQPTNFIGIEYEDTQTNQLNHGRGNEPVSYSEGPITYTGSLTLGMDEMVAIENAAPDGDIKKIKPFDIIASYLNDDNGVVHDKITCKFTGHKRTSNSGDMNLNTQLPLLITGIKYNVKI